MIELKTLKDIRFFTPGNKTEKSLGNKSIKSELRQEAIKWVKELDTCCNDKGFASEEEIQKWIKHFFNIEEKELK